MTFATPQLNEIKEVKSARASIHKHCWEDVDPSNPASVSRYESIASRSLELRTENIYYRKLQAKEIRDESKIGGLEKLPDAGPLRAIPNIFLRSALFKIESDKDDSIEAKAIECQSPYHIVLTGPELTQADLDVWLSMVFLGGGVKFGHEFDFSIGELLDACNRTKTGPNSKAAIDRLDNLSKAHIEITTLDDNDRPIGVLYSGFLIGRFFIEEKDGQHKRYHVEFDENLNILFLKDMYTLLDWKARQSLGRKPLCQWLHGYYSTHAEVHSHKIKYMHTLIGIKNQDLKKFKEDLISALKELPKSFIYFDCKIIKVKKEGGVEKRRTIGDQLIEITKEGSESQKNHIFLSRMSRKLDEQLK